jgi:hypothetical protein
LGVVCCCFGRWGVFYLVAVASWSEREFCSI